jgi:hypothetical protein
MTSKLIKIMLETTEWADGGSNHVYIFKEKPTGRSAKAIAYVPAGSKIVQRFKKPLDLDLKGRTFVELTDF